jgi:urease accessory protein UreF
LDVCLADAQRAFLFVTLRGVMSAAVRLGLVGAYEAQEAMASLAGEIDAGKKGSDPSFCI